MKTSYWLVIAITLSLLIVLGGCAPKESAVPLSATPAKTAARSASSSAPSIESKEVQKPSAAMFATDSAQNTGSLAFAAKNEGAKRGVDIDLTALSSTMLYAEVYNMMLDTESYLGKSVKMRGTYSTYYDETTEQYYHFVVIADAAACCAQGLEFIWLGEHNYPDDYPAKEAEIEIVGILKSYEELGRTYYHFETEEIIIL